MQTYFNPTLAVSVFERHVAVHPTLDHYTGILSMQGMARLAVETGDPGVLARTRDALLPFARGERQFTCNFANYLCGGNGAAYLLHHGHLPEAESTVEHYAKKTVNEAARDAAGLFCHPKRPGNLVWIDVAFAVSPFLVHAGLHFNQESWVDEAIDQTLGMVNLLRNADNGLVHQAISFLEPGVISQDHWSRGNGWAALALAELADALSADHPRRAEVLQALHDLLAAALPFQDEEEGLWHHEMTLPGSFIETSGSGLLLFALGVALSQGWDHPGARNALERGLQGYPLYIEADGSVRNTCVGCLHPGDGSILAYLTKYPRRNDVHAFGPIILLCAILERLR